MTLDSNGAPVVLERKILSDGAGTISYEVVGSVNRIVSEKVMNKIVKGRLKRNVTDSLMVWGLLCYL